MMTNAERFEQLFGLYATELWCKSEKDFLVWLNMEYVPDTNVGDTISRQEAIDAVETIGFDFSDSGLSAAEIEEVCEAIGEVRQEWSRRIKRLPSVQSERKWIPCSNPPKHHRDVLVRGTEAIGNVTVHKVMQWDVDTWRPTNYAPSIKWEEWSEI